MKLNQALLSLLLLLLLLISALGGLLYHLGYGFLVERYQQLARGEIRYTMTETEHMVNRFLRLVEINYDSIRPYSNAGQPLASVQGKTEQGIYWSPVIVDNTQQRYALPEYNDPVATLMLNQNLVRLDKQLVVIDESNEKLLTFQQLEYYAVRLAVSQDPGLIRGISVGLEDIGIIRYPAIPLDIAPDWFLSVSERLSGRLTDDSRDQYRFSHWSEPFWDPFAGKIILEFTLASPRNDGRMDFVLAQTSPELLFVDLKALNEYDSDMDTLVFSRQGSVLWANNEASEQLASLVEGFADIEGELPSIRQLFKQLDSTQQTQFEALFPDWERQLFLAPFGNGLKQGHNWYLLSRIDESSATEPYKRLAGFSFGVMLLIFVLCSSLWFWLIVRQLNRPLLALARVQEQGIGEIRNAHSRIDEIDLLLEQAREQDTINQMTEKAASPEGKPGSTEISSILVVDDEPVNLKLLVTLLKKQGFNVYACKSGSKALELNVQKRPQILLVDHHMPGMTGAELVRAIREGQHNSDVIVISMTGELPEIRDQLYSGLNVAGYLDKPIDPRSLKQLIAQLTQAS